MAQGFEFESGERFEEIELINSANATSNAQSLIFLVRPSRAAEEDDDTTRLGRQLSILKKVPNTILPNYSRKTSFRDGEREKEILMVLQDLPTVVKLLGFFAKAEGLDPNNQEMVAYLQLEYVNDVLKNRSRKLTPDEYDYIETVSKWTLHRMHARGIFHNDIRLDNCVFDGTRFCFIDFGAAVTTWFTHEEIDSIKGGCIAKAKRDLNLNMSPNVLWYARLMDIERLNSVLRKLHKRVDYEAHGVCDTVANSDDEQTRFVAGKRSEIDGAHRLRCRRRS